MKALVFVTLVIGAVPSTALAQSSSAAAPQATPCSTAEYRQLDFWVGDWVAKWENADGTKGSGKNHITKDEVGNCVITEHFSDDDGSTKGFSISMYVKPANEWRQTWMDNQGGYFNFFGGPKLYPDADFVFELFGRNGKGPNSMRMAFQDVKADSFTWRWQAKKAEEPWRDLWVIHYTRAPKSGAGR